MTLRKCGKCHRDFPKQLLEEYEETGGRVMKVCAICALEMRNQWALRMGATIVTDRFHAPRAQSMLEASRTWLKTKTFDARKLVETGPTVSIAGPDGVTTYHVTKEDGTPASVEEVNAAMREAARRL